jgi:signal transduction histidine kinase
MEVWTLKAANPRYWLSGDVKLLTAMASVATAFLLPPLVPKALKLLEQARLSAERQERLQSANIELEELYGKVKQLDELKTNFFANVSHELRTPLALIFGPVDRLLESSAFSEAASHDLRVVRRNALLLQKHVDDLLDISKLEAGKMQVHYARTDLARFVRLISSFFDSLSSTRAIQVVVEAPESLPAEVDSDKIQRVLLNLLSNAFKFTPEGGTVRIILSKEGEHALLRVEDTGPGVPPNERRAIFERFQQGEEGSNRRGGTGLGLSIVHEFVELHRGSVEVTDADGGGASFRIRIPITAPEGATVGEDAEGGLLTRGLSRAASTASAAAAETAWALAQNRASPAIQPRSAPRDGGQHPLVLVVEDNREMNEFISSTLGVEYRVRAAFNGGEALIAAREELPDLIISDMMMPEMGGEALLRAVREDPKLNLIPVIFLTAKADDPLKLNLLQDGAQDYVMKPFAVDELRARVRNQLVTKLIRDTLQRELASQESDVTRLAQDVITRSRELQAARQVAEEANRAKDRFLAVLSHELRTPLTPVLATAMHLESEENISPEVLRRSLALIRRNIELEARLIDDLLDVTRIGTGKIQLTQAPLDAHATVSAALDLCEPEAIRKASQVELHLEAEQHHVFGDDRRLLQVFWNLILNAVKFTPANGRISLRTYNPAAGKLAVEVRDSGIGISAEALPRIFEAFEQGEQSKSRQFGGLGLGLTVARAFVEAHGGTIRAASGGLGQGAIFTVELATVEPSAQATPPAPVAPAAPSDQRQLRVLLAEDHDDTRDAMQRLLLRWGYEVETAPTIAAAVEKARARKFDLLVSDIGLPDGSGTDLMRELRAFTPIEGVAISGFGADEDRQRSKEAGFSEHLTKPVGAQKLKAALEAIRCTGSAIPALRPERSRAESWRFPRFPMLPRSTNTPLMGKPELLRRIVDPGIVAIMRADSSDQLLRLRRRCTKAGST